MLLQLGSISSSKERLCDGATPTQSCQCWAAPSRSGSSVLSRRKLVSSAPGRLSRLTLRAAERSSSWASPVLVVPTTPPPRHPTQCLAFRRFCKSGSRRVRSLAKWLETNTRARSASAEPRLPITSRVASSIDDLLESAWRHRASCPRLLNQSRGLSGTMNWTLPILWT